MSVHFGIIPYKGTPKFKFLGESIEKYDQNPNKIRDYF